MDSNQIEYTSKNVNLFGPGDPREQELRTQETLLKGEAGVFGEKLVPEAFQQGGNVAINFLSTRIAELGLEDDPTFVPSEHPELLEGIGPEYIPVMERADSIEEGYMLRDSILAEHAMYAKMQDNGWKGTVALGLAGIIDADLPLALASGGTYTGTRIAGTLAKFGVQPGRKASALAVGGAGLEAGVVVSTLDAMTSPDGDFAAIPIAGLSSMVFAGAIGGLTKIDLRGNKLVQETLDDYIKNVDDVALSEVPASKIYTGQSDLEIDFDTSVGAAKLKKSPSMEQEEFEKVVMTDSVREYQQSSAEYLQREGYHTQLDFPDTKLGRSARRFKETLDKSPLKVDYDRIAALGIIGKRTAYDLYESPSGTFRNNGSAARYMEQYHMEQYVETGIVEKEAYNTWAKDRGHNKPSRMWGSGREDFWKEVIDYRASLYFDDVPTTRVHPEVQKYSDSLDNLFERTGMNAKGKSGEIPLNGFENFKPTKGWMSQQWDETAFLDNVRTPKMQKAIIRTIAKEYTRNYPGIDAKMAEKYASAVINRKLSDVVGLDTSLLGILNKDGSEALVKFLQGNNFSKADIESFMKGISGSKAEKGKIGYAKSRLDVDPRALIEGTDLRLRDFMKGNIPEVTARYSRKMAGASALARKDYQLDKLPWIQQALKQEAIANKKPSESSLIEHMFAPFKAQAIGGGVSPVTNRLMRLTSLSLLNQMGFPQLGEIGGVIAASGLEAFWKTLPKELVARFSNKNTALTKQLAGIGFSTGYDEVLFNPKWTYEILKKDKKSKIDFVDMADTLLAKGQVMQGNVSLFFAVKSIEQRISVNSFLHRMTNDLKTSGTSEGFLNRLSDVWGKDWSSIEKYFKDGTVNIINGEVDLGLSKWSNKDQGKFVRGLHSFVNQTVQKSMAGESTHWFGTDFGRILTYLKTYQLQAMQKQVVRNMRIGDNSALNLLPYGLATAGLAYYAKQVLNNSNRTDFESIAQGAFALSNTTGWIPMFSDPLAELLGLDALKISPYASSRGMTGGVLAPPAMLTTMNRMWGIPKAIARTASDTMSKSDIYALQATPILGNMLGMTAMFNGIKKDIDVRKRKERAVKVKVKLEEKAKQELIHKEPDGKKLLQELGE